MVNPGYGDLEGGKAMFCGVGMPKPLADFFNWLDKRFFMVFMVVVIFTAFAYPDAGAKGGALQSKITTGWVAVCIIFVLSGWSLKTKELVKAALYCRLNTVVQLFNLGFIPLTIYLVAAMLSATSINELLLEGMVIMACLPTTVSMCVVLTKTAGGNDAAAVFNAASGNVLGEEPGPLSYGCCTNQHRHFF